MGDLENERRKRRQTTDTIQALSKRRDLRVPQTTDTESGGDGPWPPPSAPRQRLSHHQHSSEPPLRFTRYCDLNGLHVAVTPIERASSASTVDRPITCGPCRITMTGASRQAWTVSWTVLCIMNERRFMLFMVIEFLLTNWNHSSKKPRTYSGNNRLLELYMFGCASMLNSADSSMHELCFNMNIYASLT